MISGVYCIDKAEASLNGTPVLLSRKYVHLRLPLDLPEDAISQTHENISRDANLLDPDGWNKKGEIYLMTSYRAVVVLSRCREEIIEIALGVDLVISPQQIE